MFIYSRYYILLCFFRITFYLPLYRLDDSSDAVRLAAIKAFSAFVQRVLVWSPYCVDLKPFNHSFWRYTFFSKELCEYLVASVLKYMWCAKTWLLICPCACVVRILWLLVCSSIFIAQILCYKYAHVHVSCKYLVASMPCMHVYVLRKYLVASLSITLHKYWFLTSSRIIFTCAFSLATQRTIRFHGHPHSLHDQGISLNNMK